MKWRTITVLVSYGALLAAIAAAVMYLSNSLMWALIPLLIALIYIAARFVPEHPIKAGLLTSAPALVIPAAIYTLVVMTWLKLSREFGVETHERRMMEELDPRHLIYLTQFIVIPSLVILAMGLAGGILARCAEQVERKIRPTSASRLSGTRGGFPQPEA